MSVRFAAGSVLRVPIPGGRLACGVMLATRPYMAFFDDRQVNAEKLTGFEGSPLFIVAVHNSSYSTGRWGASLGHLPKDSLPPIPYFFRQNVLRPSDCVIVDSDGNTQTAAPEDCLKLERSAVWSAEH
ncbi:MAG: hypothetical protein JWR50_4397, partial [Mucilaginibacter sp.]|nr:hypothetical protein [Mucilaginibacter sp.]